VDITNRIRAFIKQNFFVSGDLADDVSLLDRGIIDSTGVLELVAFLETEFGVRVLDEEMLPENLDSVARIAAYLERKKSAAAAA
jgi:acyl carrier protein